MPLVLPTLLSSVSPFPSRSGFESRSLSANSIPLYVKFRTSHWEDLRYLKTLGVIDPQTKPNKLPLPDAVDSPFPSRSGFESRSLSANSIPLYVKFRTSHRENLRYLKTLGVIDPKTKPNKLPLPDAVDHILVTVNFLKSKGFSDADFPRLAFLCPQLFSTTLDPTEIAPIFDFLAQDLPATVQESRGLILRCPKILFSDVEYCLKPTLHFLRQIGIQDLNKPTNLNAYLLNTRVEKLRGKIRFLESIGFSYGEATNACARLPAIFGYGIETNLQPKFEYLVNEMKRSVQELKGFPQYFGFSLEKRIMPRHLHLKRKNVRIPLNRMLMWGDEKFYAKWK